MRRTWMTHVHHRSNRCRWWQAFTKQQARLFGPSRVGGVASLPSPRGGPVHALSAGPSVPPKQLRGRGVPRLFFWKGGSTSHVSASGIVPEYWHRLRRSSYASIPLLFALNRSTLDPGNLDRRGLSTDHNSPAQDSPVLRRARLRPPAVACFTTIWPSMRLASLASPAPPRGRPRKAHQRTQDVS